MRNCFPVLLIVLSYSLTTLGQKADVESIETHCKEIHQEWFGKAFKITQNTVGFSAPVSARAYAYLSIGMYESCIDILPEYQSLSGQLDGFDRTAWNKCNEEFSYPLVVNRVDFQMINFLYANMPNEYKELVLLQYKDLTKKYSKSISKKVVRSSEAYADLIANEIIEWSKLDGANEAYKKNFPKSYVIPKCESCWIPTFPGYFNALQPFWGNNRKMIKSNGDQSNDIPFFGFSKDTNSLIFKESKEMFELEIDSEKEIIAEYWDDSPGYSRTPSGHFFEIGFQLVNQYNLTLGEMLGMYVELGVAINDAMIETWRLKFQFNLLRPITYIERYIGKGFNSIIPTPPFPEFPSGHSYQSGAGSEVLKAFFTDTIAFSDSTHRDRMDIDGSPRTFKSFTEMSEEISISRYYGGIHFPTTLTTSLQYGRKIGQNTVNSLKLKK